MDTLTNTKAALHNKRLPHKTLRGCAAFFAALLAVFVLSTSACRELLLDGDLAGQWKLTQIQFPDGTVVTADETDVHYRFYRHLGTFFSVKYGSFKANIDYNYPKLVMDFAAGVGYYPRAFGIIPPEDYKPAEGTPMVVTYTISKLSSSHLEMTSDQGVTIIARKF